MRSLEVVVGGQFGSEAKGHVTQRLTQRALADDRPVQVIRVAGPNAGHTAYDKDGEAVALRQVPIAVVVPDDRVQLGIAAGSEIDPPVLLDEIDRLKKGGQMGNKLLWISGSATIITDRDKQNEKKLVDKIGSTGKGIGEARARRLLRKADRLADDEKLCDELAQRGIPVVDHNTMPAMLAVDDHHTIIEGTQGYGLGLHTEFYPKCTSSDCRAADFMAMTGVHAWEYQQVGVWVVARIYPIRVAGESGPLLRETTWEELGLSEEKTTVTKKVRRVGMPDWNLVQRAVRANGGAPTVQVALTMFDQMFPTYKDLPFGTMPEDLDEGDAAAKIDEAEHYLLGIQARIGAHIGLITTGPNTYAFIND